MRRAGHAVLAVWALLGRVGGANAQVEEAPTPTAEDTLPAEAEPAPLESAAEPPEQGEVLQLEPALVAAVAQVLEREPIQALGEPFGTDPIDPPVAGVVGHVRAPFGVDRRCGRAVGAVSFAHRHPSAWSSGRRGCGVGSVSTPRSASSTG